MCIRDRRDTLYNVVKVYDQPIEQLEAELVARRKQARVAAKQARRTNGARPQHIPLVDEAAL